MKKRQILVLAGLVLGAMVCAGCHKTCSCISYDGATHEYTSEEVESSGVKCSALADAVNNEFHSAYYSFCEWK